MELGNVSEIELLEKEHPVYKSAEAAILFNKGRSFFNYDPVNGYVLVYEVETKLKIYKKEGYEYADIQIPFYIDTNRNRERIEFSSAVTYNLVEGKITEVKSDKRNQYIEKVNKNWNLLKISMPDVKEGSVVEYKYTIKTPFFENFPEWFFQKRIPVNYSRFETDFPDIVRYVPLTKGYHLPKVLSDNKSKKDITIYISENLPAIKEEDFVGNVDDYASSIRHELALVNIPGVHTKVYSKTWDDVSKLIFENENLGNQLKKSSYFEKHIDILLANVDDEKTKINNVLEFVKKNVVWNKREGIYCVDGVKSAFANKTGNAAEINLMLTSMLNYSGFKADPVLLSTRSNGVQLVPSITAFNYLITAVETSEGLLFLDATDYDTQMNVIPIKAINGEGRLIKSNGTSTGVSLTPAFVSKRNNVGMITLNENGKTEGRIKTQYSGYNAYLFRNHYKNMIESNYLDLLEKKYNDIEIFGYEIYDKENLEKPVLEKFNFRDSNSCEIIGDKMFFYPLLFLTMLENIFKQDERHYPIDFIYPQEDKYFMIFKIPDGYEVESIPEEVAFTMEDKFLIYRFEIEITGSEIKLTSVLNINEPFVKPLYYKSLKDFYKKIVEKQTEKIVLKKS